MAKKNRNKLMLLFTFYFLLFTFRSLAQFTGGNADGYSLVSKTDVAVCTLPGYSNISTGGNADGYSLVSKTDVAVCTLPGYSNISTGGNADGYFLSSSGCLEIVALPIELLSFDATPKKDNNGKYYVRCNWQTATEINNDYFSIERGREGKTFEQIGIRKGAGNSTTILYYSFDDENPYTGTSYYRLKQVDFNGDSSYSDIRAVNLEGIDIINLSPNPAEKEITVLLYSTEKTKVNINVYNILGQSVKTRHVLSQQHALSSIPVSNGTNEIKIDVSTFNTGYYLLEVETETGMYRVQRKLIKN